MTKPANAAIINRLNRLLPHHQTHYPALFGIVLVAGLMLLGLSSTARSDPPPVSGSYTVTGVVSSLIPILPPTITSPKNGAVFTVSPSPVVGRCQVGDLIKIFRNGLVAGADYCDATGRFDIPIGLQLGQNGLFARAINAGGDQADSAVVTITFRPLATTASAPPGITPLQILGDTSYRSFQLNQETSWPLQITGGQPPYTITIDWGDHATDVVKRSQAGSFVVKHTFVSQPDQGQSYGINLKASDATGQTATLHLAALLVLPPPSHQTNVELLAWPVWAALLAILTIAHLAAWLEREQLAHRQQKVLALANRSRT